MITTIPAATVYQCDSCGDRETVTQPHPSGRPRHWSRIEHSATAGGTLRLLLCASCSTRASQALSAMLRRSAA